MNAVFPAAIALFALAIAAEAWAARRRGRRIHDRRQVVSDLSCGLLRGLADVATKGAVALVYGACAALVSPWELPATHPGTWLFALLLYDALYYWSHRASHHVAPLWANHAVHHQTRDFHLAIGFRAGVFGPLLSLPFFLPMAAIGVPATVYFGVTLAHGVLMFWLHSRFAGDGGRLGLILNTPSHHRVHHSRDDKHFDRNFGGLLIVWDRLFDTFAPERDVGEATEFGLPELERAEILDPIGANLWGWREMARRIRAAEGPGDRLAAFAFTRAPLHGAARANIGRAAAAADRIRP